MAKEKSFFLYIYLKLRLNTVKHNTKAPNLLRKVPDFLLIPSYFFHTPPHFLDTALQTCPLRSQARTKKRHESPHLGIPTARNCEKEKKASLSLPKDAHHIP